MTFERFASIADSISGVAIVATLIILILDVRTNRALLERQIEMDRINVTSQPIESAYLSDILVKTNAARGFRGVSGVVDAFMNEFQLTESEAQRFTRYLRQQWFVLQADYRSGLSENLDRDIQRNIRFSDHMLFWRASEETFDEDFRRYVNAFISDMDQ